ncbi:hypothetical protein UFOVP368_62 [uncultured Caudovirales phage]|uniref:Uncharacterized protein n=1 Tax=uncultured Caudovirales phage TaxID=2100421 RepID=A0A6J7X780_9CAUD|nr:hypothetical protein UFOVP368_62 [uncultured Caudovirales phage]
MKAGWGNGTFIADAHNPKLSLDDIRNRWKAGDYGKPRADFANEWLRLANRTPPAGRKVTM